MPARWPATASRYPVKLIALTLDERSIILGSPDDPPDGLAELRAVLMNEREWRRREGLN